MTKKLGAVIVKEEQEGELEKEGKCELEEEGKGELGEKGKGELGEARGVDLALFIICSTSWNVSLLKSGIFLFFSVSNKKTVWHHFFFMTSPEKNRRTGLRS